MGKIYKLDEEELRKHLDEELMFLQKSAGSYDQGDFAEAKRLAVSIRKLLHDTNSRSYSLLSQLKLKELEFADTRIPPFELEERNDESRVQIISPYSGLIMISLQGNNYIPLLDSNEETDFKWVNFEDWWEKEIIFDNNDDLMLTRKDLVLSVADQEGAHIDPELDPVYASLTKNNALKTFTVIFSTHQKMERIPLSSLQPVNFPAYAAVRQIAHELLKTLLPDYTPPAQTLREKPFLGQTMCVFRKTKGTESTTLAPVNKTLFTPPILKGPKRNKPCPCGSGKKYKKCCGK